jgi:riboflavin kinase/FMN adenylyltransferase
MISKNTIKPFKNLPLGEYGVVLGNFDGVHLGHQTLIKNFRDECINANLKSILITFNPHPSVFFSNDDSEFLISSYEDKKFLLANLGLDEIIELEFSEELQNMTAEDFILEILFSIHSLKLVYLGHDFKLGKGKTDAFEIISQLAGQHEITIKREKPYSIKGDVVSSSRIRNAIKSDINLANELLGRAFMLDGSVEEGRRIGGKSLFHTANLETKKNQILPSSGVYLTQVIWGNKVFDSITNVGCNPTIHDENPVTIETHIFHFKEDIYNEEIDLFFLSKLREEIKFNGLDSLKSQIIKDIEIAKIYFRKSSPFKLALIGKDISHSKSQSVYESLLQRFVNYTLLDFSAEKEISSLRDLKEKYQGVSITSPYKKHFINDLKLENTNLNAINCLTFESNLTIGHNTDYYAVRDILTRYVETGVKQIFILGDGAMAELTRMVLKELHLEFKQLSRKMNNLDTSSNILKDSIQDVLVINTCHRDYCFSPPPSGSFHFWDMNYNLDHHTQLFSKTNISYSDGMELLHLQAKYALSFWNLKTI